MLKRVLGDISKCGTNNSSIATWETKSTLTKGTEFDHMMNFLNAQGFSGHPRDAIRAWAQSVGGNKGTLYDNLKSYYNKTAHP